MSRLNQFLLLLVLLQVGMVFFMAGSSRQEEEASTSLLEGRFVKEIKIDDGINELHLRKDDQGWVLPRAGGVLIDQKKIQTLVESLEKISLGRPVVKNPASYRRLKVADDQYLRRVNINNGEVAFLLGTSLNPQVSHLRLAQGEGVYQIEGLSLWNLGVHRSQWIVTQIIDVRKPDIEEFTLTTDQGSFHFTKNKDDRYDFHDSFEAPDEHEFDAVAFGIWVNQQGSWFLSDVVDRETKPEYGFDQPTALVKFKLRKKEANDSNSEEESLNPEFDYFTLAIGAKVPDKNEYYAQGSDQNRIVTVPADRVQKLLDRDRQSFYKKITQEESSR